MGNDGSKITQDPLSDEFMEACDSGGPSTPYATSRKSSVKDTKDTDLGTVKLRHKKSSKSHRNSLELDDAPISNKPMPIKSHSSYTSPIHSPGKKTALNSGDDSPHRILSPRSASTKKRHFRFSKQQSQPTGQNAAHSYTLNDSHVANGSTGSSRDQGSSLEIATVEPSTSATPINGPNLVTGPLETVRDSLSSRFNISFRNFGGKSTGSVPNTGSGGASKISSETGTAGPSKASRTSLTRGESLPASARKSSAITVIKPNPDSTTPETVITSSGQELETGEKRRSSISLNESALRQQQVDSEQAFENVAPHPRDSIPVPKIQDAQQLSQESAEGVEKAPEPEAQPEKPVKSKAEQALERRKYVLAELVETEREYVKDLGSIVDGYMTAIRDRTPCPPDSLLDKEKIVWGNLEQIYEWHRDVFSKEIEKCLENPETVGWAFVKYERRFQMYVVYCQNKPKSEYIVSEFLDSYFEEVRLKLGHKLTLADLLIKPVQRIMKYQLLLKDLLKLTERTGQDTTLVKKAVEVMCVVPKTANDMMKLSRLQGWDGKVSAQGKLLIQDLLTVSPGPPTQPFKGKEWQVFLFEQIVLFSEPITSGVNVAKKFTNAGFIYKNSIKTSKLSLAENVEGEPLKFILTGKSPEYGEMHFVVQMPTKEAKDIWIHELKSMLSLQRDFLRALQSPIAYQKNLNEGPSPPFPALPGPLPTPGAASGGQGGTSGGGGRTINNLVSKFGHSTAKPPRLPVSGGVGGGKQGGLAGFFSGGSRSNSPKRQPQANAAHGSGAGSNKGNQTAIKGGSVDLKGEASSAIPPTAPSHQPPPRVINKSGSVSTTVDRSTTQGSTGLLATLKKAVSQPSRNKLNESQKKLTEVRYRQNGHHDGTGIPTIHSATSLNIPKDETNSGTVRAEGMSKSLSNSPNASTAYLESTVQGWEDRSNEEIKSMSSQKILAIRFVPPRMYPLVGLVRSDKANYVFTCLFPRHKPAQTFICGGALLTTRDMSAQLVEALIRMGIKSISGNHKTSQDSTSQDRPNLTEVPGYDDVDSVNKVTTDHVKSGPRRRLTWYKVFHDISIPKTHRERVEQRKAFEATYFHCNSMAAHAIAHPTPTTTTSTYTSSRSSRSSEEHSNILNLPGKSKLSPTSSLKLTNTSPSLNINQQWIVPREMPANAITVINDGRECIDRSSTDSSGSRITASDSLALMVTFNKCRLTDTGTYFLYFDDGHLEHRSSFDTSSIRTDTNSSESRVDDVGSNTQKREQPNNTHLHSPTKSIKRSGSSQDVPKLGGVQSRPTSPGPADGSSNEHPSMSKINSIFKPEHSFPFYLLVLDAPYLLWKPSIAESSQAGVRINWRLPPQIENTFAMLPFTIELQHSNTDEKSLWSPICTQILTHSAIVDKFIILRDSPKFRLRVVPENSVGRGPPSEPSDIIKFELIPGIPAYSGDDPMIWLSGFFEDYSEKRVLLKGYSCRLALLTSKKDKEYVGKYVERNVRGGESVANEYNILRRVQPHPNIMAVFGAYATPRRFIIILEKMNGENLINHFRKTNRYSEIQVWDLIYQICNALDYLHSQNIAHLDICPRNVFIIPSPDVTFPFTELSHFTSLNGTVKLAGFSNASHFPLPPSGSAQRPSVYMNPFHAHFTAPEIFLRKIINHPPPTPSENLNSETEGDAIGIPVISHNFYPYPSKSNTNSAILNPLFNNLTIGTAKKDPNTNNATPKISNKGGSKRSNDKNVPSEMGADATENANKIGKKEPTPNVHRQSSLLVPGEPVLKSDVWSLGVLMLYLLTGGLEPFSGLGPNSKPGSVSDSREQVQNIPAGDGDEKIMGDGENGDELDLTMESFVLNVDHDKLTRIISSILSFDPLDYLEALGPPVMSEHARNFLRMHMLVFEVAKRSSIRKCFSDPVLLKGPPTKTTSILPNESWLPLFDGTQLSSFDIQMK